MTLRTNEGFIVLEVHVKDRIAHMWILSSDVDANIFARQMVLRGFIKDYVIRRANVAEFETK